MTKEIITAGPPGANNPLSSALRLGNMLFPSSQVGHHPQTGKLAAGIADQTHQTLAYLQTILKAGRTAFDKVLRSSCSL
jgi:enamine deaminase RidA (YjgF/YER057c/UK114 family)